MLGQREGVFQGMTLLQGDGLQIVGDFEQEAPAFTYVGPTSRLKATRSVIIGGGTLKLDGGSVEGPSGVEIRKGAQVDGRGTITGRTANAGTIHPEAADATRVDGNLMIEGSYVQTGTLRIDVAGTKVGTYSKLAVTDKVTFGGTIVVELADGFVPAIGDSFPLVVCPKSAGKFTTERLPQLPEGRAWNAVADRCGPTGYTLKVVPKS